MKSTIFTEKVVMETSQKILVLGASGYVGSRLVARLVDEGYRVRAAARSLGRLKQRPWAYHPHVELYPVDVLDRRKLKEACISCRMAFYLIHSMDPSHKNFAECDRQAAQNMVWASQEGELKRIIYLGGLGEVRSDLSKHLRSRMEVGKVLQSGFVPVTTLRAAMIIGSSSASFEILGYLVRRLPVMITPRWVRTESQPIAICNVLNYLSGCIEKEETEGQTYDIGGPDIVSYLDLMDIYTQEAKLRKRIIIPLSFLTPRLSSYWINLVTPLSASIARPLAEGLRNRVVCIDNAIKAIIPQRLYSCREAIRVSLDLQPCCKACGEKSIAHCPPVGLKYPGDPSWARTPGS